MFKKIFAYMQMLPHIISMIQTVEAAIPLPKAGQAKLDAVLGAIQIAYTAEQEIQNSIPWNELKPMVTETIKMFVGVFNSVGLFKKSN